MLEKIQYSSYLKKHNNGASEYSNFNDCKYRNKFDYRTLYVGLTKKQLEKGNNLLGGW